MTQPPWTAIRSIRRLIVIAMAVIAAAIPMIADAHVLVSFRSFNGSLFGSRFPHTFIELSGTLDRDGRTIHENYGFTAATISTAILRGPVPGTIDVEDQKYLATTNVHFTVPISDAQYTAIRAEVTRWRDAPGRSYDLQTHNCIHFVARIAEIVGLTVAIPADMVKRPKAWLNYITTLNPQLHARPIG